MRGLGPYATGGPIGDCTPPFIGLTGVKSCDGKIHDGERPGHAASTCSGSTVRLGGSSRHIFEERAACVSDFSRVFNISV